MIRGSGFTRKLRISVPRKTPDRFLTTFPTGRLDDGRNGRNAPLKNSRAEARNWPVNWWICPTTTMSSIITGSFPTNCWRPAPQPVRGTSGKSYSCFTSWTFPGSRWSTKRLLGISIEPWRGSSRTKKTGTPASCWKKPFPSWWCGHGSIRQPPWTVF